MDHVHARLEAGLTAAAHGANDAAPAPAQASTQQQQIPCLFSKQFGSLAAPPQQQVMEALPTIALRHRTSSQDSTYTAPSASEHPVGAIKPLTSLAGFGALLHQDSLAANNMQHCSLAVKLASSPSLQQQEQQPQQLAAGTPERSAATLCKQQPAEAAAAASPGFSSAAQAAAQLMPFHGALPVAAGGSQQQQQQQQQQAAQPAAAPAEEEERSVEGLAMRASDGDDNSTDDGGCADMDHLDDVAAAEILIGLRSASLQQSNSGWGSGTDSDGEAAPGAAAGTSPAAAAAAGAGLHRHHSGGINLFAPSSTLAAHLAAAESGHSFVMHPARADPAAAAAAAVGFGPLQGRFSLGSSSSRHASLPGSSPSHCGHHGMASSYGGSPLLVRTSAGGGGSSSSGRGMHEYGALGSPAHSAFMPASPAAATATPSPRRGSHSRHPDCKCQKACKPHEACHACGATHSPGGTWRTGTNGPRTLCNACGMRWKRMMGLLPPRNNNRASSSSGFGPRGGGVSKGGGGSTSGGGSTAGSGGYAPRGGSSGGGSFSDAGFRMAAAYVQQHLLGQQPGSDGC